MHVYAFNQICFLSFLRLSLSLSTSCMMFFNNVIYKNTFSKNNFACSNIMFILKSRPIFKNIFSFVRLSLVRAKKNIGASYKYM